MPYALLLADVDGDRMADIETLVGDYEHDEVDYANARTLVARHEDGVIYAAQPDERLAYHYDPATSRLVIVGAHTEPVAVAASRLARELVRGQLLRAGFHILHASCVVRALPPSAPRAPARPPPPSCSPARDTTSSPTTGCSSVPRTVPCGSCPGRPRPRSASAFSSPPVCTSR
ncbi:MULTISPECIES: hypothetical protein [unclassified Streptomyces]|uniref:hypothetical protein n=1 Tax=unclassified Streptomyces TaxID=2593676 RepID=UPI00039E8D87|nr:MULTISPECIES: hypothetical protein [unclassified Streptomyces]